MSLEELKERSKNYILSKEEIDEREKGRLSFVSMFPLEKIKDLTVDQYAQGTDENSFCYWLEFKKILFGIGGGNASKFGLYKAKKDGLFYHGTGNNKKALTGKELDLFFSDLKSKILQALEHTENDEIVKIRSLEIPIWNMVLQKILSIYYPNKFLTICSPKVLIKCAENLKLEDIEITKSNSIELNYECKKLLSGLPEFNDWPYEKIGAFLWRNYDGEMKKGKSNDSQKYWLYAPGENARKWDEFYSRGIMGLGWDAIGDLRQYNNRTEIKAALTSAYGGTGSKKNDVSANHDFLKKIKIGDIIIVKKGRGELLGYGEVISDYEYHTENSEYQKERKVDWKLKGSWQLDFSLVLKTLTDITKYPSDLSDHESYHEFLLDIMEQRIKLDDKRAAFIQWLKSEYGKNSGTTTSYVKAIDILSQILSKELFTIVDDKFLSDLYIDLLKEQGNPEGRYYNQEAPSYGSNGFYSASIKSYREFLSVYQNERIKTEHMNFPLNTMLYGPPGTGKTYNTILRAAEIIEDRKINSYEEALDIFNANLHERVEFITFHQNYSYEDFIQGLRPDTENNSQLTFERKDGVFKEIADRALINYNESKKAPNEISNAKAFEEALETLKDKVLDSETPIKINQRAYFTAVEDNAFRYSGDNWTLKDKGFNGFRMKYSDLKRLFEEGITERKAIKKLSNISGLAKQHATYFFKAFELVKSFMSKTSIRIPKIERKNYVIIIDEINRANISRVFGELITLIEPDKRSGGRIPLEARLPSGDPFIVPSNLYIIGTMNTADKSIALLDIALRRRFEFEAMYPQYEINGEEIYDAEILQKINKQIINSKGHDFQIGHAYFMGENKDLLKTMNKKVIPLLLEYYMNDEKEVTVILETAGLAIEKDSWPLKISGRND